jgi:hypothetical protein
VTDVVCLDLLREMTRRHVFDHALAQRTDGLVGQGDSSCLTRGHEPRDFETGPAVLFIPTSDPVRAGIRWEAYRESGLVLGGKADVEDAPFRGVICAQHRPSADDRGAAEADVRGTGQVGSLRRIAIIPSRHPDRRQCARSGHWRTGQIGPTCDFRGRDPLPAQLRRPRVRTLQSTRG